MLVVDAYRLTWRGQPDEQLRAIVTAAIQVVTVQQRAAAAGIDPGQLHAVMAPVPVENQQLGVTAGRSSGNVAATVIMSMLLLMAIVLYGNLVLTGVAEEKSSRVVEVLLARMPARNLLAGKVTGIGLLGFAQFAVTALAALVAALTVHPSGSPPSAAACSPGSSSGSSSATPSTPWHTAHSDRSHRGQRTQRTSPDP